MDEMLRKEDVLKALSEKIDGLEKRDAKADVILGLATAMSVVKLMEGEPAEKEEPCTDAISRQAVMDCFKKWQPYMATRLFDFEKELLALPPVTPAEKVGHWLGHQEDRWIYAKCSECETIHDTRTNYCPNCCAKMGGEQNE